MKKILFSLLLLCSTSAFAARDVVIVIPNVPTTDEVKEKAKNMWDTTVEVTKEGTRKAGEVTGRVLEQAGEKLQEYSRPEPSVTDTTTNDNVIIDKSTDNLNTN